MGYVIIPRIFYLRYFTKFYHYEYPFLETQQSVMSENVLFDRWPHSTKNVEFTMRIFL